MIRFFLTIGLATFSAGCTTIGMFKNELAVVPGTQQLRFISFYGPVGIAAKIDSPAASASSPAIKLGDTK